MNIVTALCSQFLLTRPLRDVTRSGIQNTLHAIISTHTPLAGRDVKRLEKKIETLNFYSHAPCGT